MDYGNLIKEFKCASLIGCYLISYPDTTCNKCPYEHGKLTRNHLQIASDMSIAIESLQTEVAQLKEALKDAQIIAEELARFPVVSEELAFSMAAGIVAIGKAKLADKYLYEVYSGLPIMTYAQAANNLRNCATPILEKYNPASPKGSDNR